MARRHRILFLSTCVRGGGAGWSLLRLLEHLDGWRFEAVVGVPTPGIFADSFEKLGIRYVILPGMPERLPADSAAPARLAGLGRAAIGAARLARAEGIDLIYCNNMLTKPIGWVAGAIAGRPVVFHCRNIHDSPLGAAFYPGLARSPWVRCVVCNSEASAEPYSRVVPGKTLVIYNGVDLPAERTGRRGGGLRISHGFSKEAPAVAYFGNLIPRKGALHLVEAAPHILRRHPEARVFIVGDAPVGDPGDYRRRLQHRAAELSLGPAVRFIGAVPDIGPYLSRTAVAVVPSEQEPFGRVLIEAMAAGVPVVATRVGGIPEIVTDGENGLLVPPANPEKIAEAVCALLDDPTLRQRLARAGRETVRRRFAAPTIARQVERVVLDVLESAPAA
ncbi:MAG: glycosyltransferase family 4 protein [Nitrospirae bacterium]|nr:glycosyltransferase family 4 protein [Nitrospirota bacterium]